MNREIKNRETLVYYDGPELFVGTDTVNTRYICLLVGKTPKSDTFLCIPISPQRLSDFCAGEIELRSLFAEPEVPEFYTAEITDESELIVLNAFTDEIPDDWIPGSCFFLPQEKTNDMIIMEARIPVYDLSNTRRDLTIEQRVLTGRVVTADVRSGRWTLRSDESDREYSGRVAESSGLSLSGIVLESKVYRFICEEKIVEMLGSGTERTSFFLKAYESQ